MNGRPAFNAGMRWDGNGRRGLGEGAAAVIKVSGSSEVYVAWLSRMTGKLYRLLSEAEWEYAARGVTRLALPSIYPGATRQATNMRTTAARSRAAPARLKDGTGGLPAPVGSFPRTHLDFSNARQRMECRGWLAHSYAGNPPQMDRSGKGRPPSPCGSWRVLGGHSKGLRSPNRSSRLPATGPTMWVFGWPGRLLPVTLTPDLWASKGEVSLSTLNASLHDGRCRTTLARRSKFGSLTWFCDQRDETGLLQLRTCCTSSKALDEAQVSFGG